MKDIDWLEQWEIDLLKEIDKLTQEFTSVNPESHGNNMLGLGWHHQLTEALRNIEMAMFYFLHKRHSQKFYDKDTGRFNATNVVGQDNDIIIPEEHRPLFDKAYQIAEMCRQLIVGEKPQ